jgi:hypothetical protein
MRRTSRRGKNRVSSKQFGAITKPLKGGGEGLDGIGKLDKNPANVI